MAPQQEAASQLDHSMSVFVGQPARRGGGNVMPPPFPGLGSPGESWPVGAQGGRPHSLSPVCQSPLSMQRTTQTVGGSCLAAPAALGGARAGLLGRARHVGRAVQPTRSKTVIRVDCVAAPEKTTDAPFRAWDAEARIAKRDDIKTVMASNLFAGRVFCEGRRIRAG